jgi:hypothetical protein
MSEVKRVYFDDHNAEKHASDLLASINREHEKCENDIVREIGKQEFLNGWYPRPFCPLIKDECNHDCQCFVWPHKEYSTSTYSSSPYRAKSVTVVAGYCDNAMFEADRYCHEY